MKTSREISFLALTQKKLKVEQFLKVCQEKGELSTLDLKLAKELTLGVTKRLLSLEYISQKLPCKLKIEKKALTLLYLALYQYYFLDKIPHFAIVNETVELAKRYLRKGLSSFFNAILRRLPKDVPLPKDRLDVFYSYPTYFIDSLINEYGLKVAENILKIGNQFFSPMVRQRGTLCVEIKEKELDEYINRSDCYIQNATPVALITQLASHYSLNELKENIAAPLSILDLCSSPGGKLLLASELFPKSTLFANDISEAKLKLLSSNLTKYNVKATLYKMKGEEFESNIKFDLIIIDAPCSNSGVLNKRTEARWRICEKTLLEHKRVQLALLKRAKDLLSPSGAIWYMTCSILKQENEEVITESAQLGLKELKKIKILPNYDGWDGGFGCALGRSSDEKMRPH